MSHAHGTEVKVGKHTRKEGDTMHPPESSFPVARNDYNTIIGALRVHNLEKIISSMGFVVHTEAVQNSDVDLWAYNQAEERVLVAEVINWHPRIEMYTNKGESTQDNFKNYKCAKLFLCSSEKNYSTHPEYIDKDVDTLAIGWQTQPPAFYDWFKAKGDEDGRRPNTPATLELLKQMITDYFAKRGIISPSFI